MGFQIGLVVRNICFWPFSSWLGVSSLLLKFFLGTFYRVICLVNFINYLVKKIDSCCDSLSKHL